MLGEDKFERLVNIEERIRAADRNLHVADELIISAITSPTEIDYTKLRDAEAEVRKAQGHYQIVYDHTKNPVAKSKLEELRSKSELLKNHNLSFAFTAVSDSRSYPVLVRALRERFKGPGLAESIALYMLSPTIFGKVSKKK